MKRIHPTLTFLASMRFVPVALAILLAACAGGFPGGDQDDEPLYFDNVEGTVDHVDTRSRAVVVITDRDSPVAPGQRVDVHYDERTTVSYQGVDYRPEDLEPGDRIVAQVQEEGRALEAQSIVVIEDVSPDEGEYASNISGTLQRIDRRDRTLTVETHGTRRDTVVTYDSRTRVYYDDRLIGISELREFDEVEIELVRGSRDELADVITVIDGASDPAYEEELATARGDVVRVDERDRELVISTRDPLISSFDVGEDDLVTFRYDADVVVEYGGDYYSPSSLERGDGVEVEYERIDDELWAERILVTSDVRN